MAISEGLMQTLEVVTIASLASVALMASLGAFWMVWAGARHDRFLAAALEAGFVPFSFVRYYARRANEAEKRQLVRVFRIGLTVVWTIAGVVLISRGGLMRIAAVPLLIICFYISYLVSKRERDELRHT